MKKSILKLGKKLNKTEQKNINGNGGWANELCVPLPREILSCSDLYEGYVEITDSCCGYPSLNAPGN